MTPPLFDDITSRRGDSPELIAAMADTVAKLDKSSSQHPGMLLGKIQAGKTRAFIGIIARGFDEGFDFAIVLTKGTQALSEQTMKRLNRDFADAVTDDRLKVYDIMHLPKNGCSGKVVLAEVVEQAWMKPAGANA